CRTPVVASAVGGIPDVVTDGETGRLVSFAPVGPDNAEPRDPQRFARDLADGIQALIDRPDLGRTLGLQARRRVEDHFSWQAVAERTMAFYQRTLETHQQAGH
ncbi:MAG: glycosyltransferase, partial [Desulfobacterales bacterium]|nr:glycosyltransferase [Desulfobacterales bacterium]